jgi:hypothetical protein
MISTALTWTLPQQDFAQSSAAILINHPQWKGMECSI